MMTFLITGLIMAASAQAQTSRNCADSNAEVSACPENYLPKLIIPSTSSKQGIFIAIAAANVAKAAETAALSELARLKEAANDDPKDGEYVKQLRVVQAATKETYDLSNEAIRLTVAAYNLTPPVPDFTGDPRASVLMTAKPWLPRYSEREKYDEDLGRYRIRDKKELAEEAAKSQAAIGGAGSVAAAQTWTNGEISMYSQAISDPDDLAILIYHETSHWVDIAAKPGGGRKSDLPIVTSQSEADAYARSAKIAQQLGRDPTPMLALAVQFEWQAKDSGDRSWEWVILNRRNWLGIDRRGPLAMVPAETEVASDGEAVLRQKMSEAQRGVRKSREYMEHLEAEARKVRHEHQENARRKRQADEELDAVVASCGYEFTFQGGSGKFLGFSGIADREYLFLNNEHKVELDMNDIRLGLLIARACHEVEFNTQRASPHACNNPAAYLTVKIWKPDFSAKFDYFFGARNYRNACLNNFFDRANEISDAASFDKFISQYHKHLIKDRRKLAEQSRAEGGGYVAPPQGRGGHVAPPQGTNPCQRGNDPFGCQRPHQ